MFHRRIWLGILAFLMMLLGLYSRSMLPMPAFFHMYGGDVLWASMIYFLVAILFVNKPAHIIFVFSLLFCVLIECSQLIEWSWLVYLRHTPLRYLLGQGFVWSDLLCYFIGCLLAFGIDEGIVFLIQKKRGNLPLRDHDQ